MIELAAKVAILLAGPGWFHSLTISGIGGPFKGCGAFKLVTNARTPILPARDGFLMFHPAAEFVKHPTHNFLEAILRYIPPFDLIKQSCELTSSKGQLIATATYENLTKMIKQLLLSVEVDETWYLATYRDVAEAIGQGTVTSARQHFIDNGYFEGRLPFAIKVDDEWYQREYPDVAESIRNGGESSAQAHFNRDGYKEGRAPFPLT